MARDTVLRCTVCGHSERVSYAYCLGHGWPRCCGKTMRQVSSTADIDAVIASLFAPVRRVIEASQKEGGGDGA